MAPRKNMLASTLTAAAIVLCSLTSAAQDPPTSASAAPPLAPGWAIAGVAGNHLEVAAAPHFSAQHCRLPCVSLQPSVAQSGVGISVHAAF